MATNWDLVFVTTILIFFLKYSKFEVLEFLPRTGYSPEQRLRYHQKHSGRIMEKFRRWAILQVCRKKVEPNDELGRALKYFLKHYQELTLFLRPPGAPVDNNIVEALLKIPI